MSTRGAYGFRHKNRDYIAYNHFDSYPSGLGSDVAKFIYNANRNNMWGAARRTLDEVKIKDLDDIPTEEELRLYLPFVPDSAFVSSLFIERSNDPPVTLKPRWGRLFDRTMGNIAIILESRVCPEQSAFLINSLFCEWAYIVNLDEELFEVYVGGNEDPNAPGRYAKFKRDTTRTDNYYGVALLFVIPLDFVTPQSLAQKVKEVCGEHFELLRN